MIGKDILREFDIIRNWSQRSDIMMFINSVCIIGIVAYLVLKAWWDQNLAGVMVAYCMSLILINALVNVMCTVIDSMNHKEVIDTLEYLGLTNLIKEIEYARDNKHDWL